MILMLNSSEPLKKVALIETGRVPFGVSVLFRVLFLCLDVRISGIRLCLHTFLSVRTCVHISPSVYLRELMEIFCPRFSCFNILQTTEDSPRALRVYANRLS